MTTRQYLNLPSNVHQPVPSHDQPKDMRPEANMVLASQIAGATPAGDYTWRPPSPPHIHVPQAPEDKEYLLPQPKNIRQDYGIEDQELLQQLLQVDRGCVSVKDWKYEQRRGAQMILPFLYLGPSSAARDTKFLAKEGITMLLVIRDSMSAFARLLSGEKAAAELGIEADAIDVASNMQLIAAFRPGTKTINDHLLRVYKHRVNNGADPNDTATRGKVLVFCESGNERSAAFVAAYLMSTYSIDLISAIQFVQGQRFCVAFDDALKSLLANYQDLLNAQLQIMGTGRPGSPAFDAGSKRRRERDEDSDMDMDQEDDRERFGGRGNFAPFRDSADRPIAPMRMR